VKLDVSDAAVSKQVASDAHMCRTVCCSLWVTYTLQYFLNAASPVGSGWFVRMIWLSLLGIRRTRDGLSFNMIWKSWFIAVIGLNFLAL